MSASKERRERADLRETGSYRKMNEKAEQALKDKKRKTKTWIILIVCVVIAILVILFGTNILYSNCTAVKAGDVKFTTADYNFYRSSLAQNYRSYYTSTYTGMEEYIDLFMPDDETMQENTLDLMKSIAARSSEAVKAGHTLSEEGQQSLENQMNAIQEAANNNGVTLNTFLAASYGRGVNEKTVRENLSMWLLADEYGGSIQDSISYTDEEVDAYYEEHRNDIDKVTFNNYFIDGSAVEADPDMFVEGVDSETAMANAKATADEFISMLDSGETFIDTAFMLAKDEDKPNYQAENACETSAAYPDIQPVLADWLYDSSRKPGDYEMFLMDGEGSTPGYMILQYLSTEDNSYSMVDVRHILIKPEAVSEEDFDSDEECQAALTAADEAAAAKAQEIYDQFLAGDATEESFAKLAEEYSEDGSASAGGLIEGIKKGDMVAEFNDWCFDTSRKAGDTGIVKTQYGYHIMYFVGYGEPYSRYVARDLYESSTYDSWLEECESGYPVQTSGLFSIAKVLDVVK